ncbi:amino acid ABC transporter ATP-binding protein [Herbaspirillum rubrisubalbicans]|uniref:amino acid ABC transporter ATP-binding protein n=1 Tax=Herbaspirillum rubrisubalbicans TaxID=80842 RepID=UPI0015592852|nr:amino acid ABC transporter ATP-binding protein [Herbaspirillum rubrisubalbicans]NQE50596.1 phosphate ABC transporter ATP-binding protein [Herbaspirillum rubrisubalbicans]
MPSIESPDQALVSLRDVHLTLGGNAILRGIDLEVQRGQAVSIIGPSGSGKSTILRCITGLLHPHQGQILVDGVELGTLRSEAQLARLRQRVGFVFQQYNLFPHLTVLENLVMAPIRILGLDRSTARSRALALLERVRLAGKADAYPGQLSGGQQQRVAIARALAMQPELILFDEVTSALDPEMVGEVLAVIRELVQEGMTCVLVTHEMRFAEEVSDQVHFIESGRVVEHGAASHIFSAPDNERTRAFLNRALNGERQATRNSSAPIAFNRLAFSI